MSRSLTQRAVHALALAIAPLPPGSPVNLRDLLRAAALPARAPLVGHRLRAAGWIAPDGRGGWVRTDRTPRGHSRPA